MSMKANIRWGITGTGNIAHKMADTLKLFKKEGEITAVLSRSLEKGEKFAKEYKIKNVFTSLEEFAACKELDIVYVATPHNLHKRDVLASLINRKHVLCEKSMGLNEYEVKEMNNLAKEKNLFLMEAMWTAFFPATQKMLELIKDGKIGKVRLIDIQFCFLSQTTDNERWFNRELAGGALLDLGIYCIYLSQLIMNQYPKSIAGEAYFGKTGVDEQNAIILKYSEGQLAVLTSSLKTQAKQHATIYGTEGYIEIPLFYQPDYFVLRTHSGKKKKYSFKRKGTGYHYEIGQVIADLKNKTTENSIITHQLSLDVVRIMDTIRKQWNLVYPSEHIL